MAIEWDNDRRAWVFDDVTEVDPGHFNNLLQWGQPYSPYDSEFRHDLYDGDHMITSPTVIFGNQDVITYGYGQNIQLTDFDVVQNLQRDGANIPDGTYTLTDLQNLGLSAPGQFGDHAMGTNLYFNQGGVGVSPQLGAATAAYVFGSIRFQMSQNTTFVIENGQLVSVDGQIELQPDNFNHESTTLPDWVSAIVAIGAGDTVNFEEVIILYEGEGPTRTINRLISESEECFLPGTLITLADGTTKPIEEIVPGDLVASYDNAGRIVPGRVTRTFTNDVRHVLDVFGLHVTPGHVTYCADGVFAGRHVPIIDILRTDGALMREDGSRVRAATGAEVGSDADRMVVTAAIRIGKDGQVTETERRALRCGTRLILENGTDVSILELIEAAGAQLHDCGLVDAGDGDLRPFLWPGGEKLPTPEAFIMQKSKRSLSAVYDDAEWEGMRPQLPAPGMSH